MEEAERRALASLKFDLAPTPDDVWRSSPVNVDDLHRDTVEKVFHGLSEARDDDVSNPLGVVIQGRSGIGKTHMLGMVRARTQKEGGYFFLVSLANGPTFWESVALCMVEGLMRPSHAWPTQLKAFLRRLTPMLGLTPELRDVVAGDESIKPVQMKEFINALRKMDPVLGQEVKDTARALVLQASQDFDAQDLGRAYLASLELTDYPERTEWGFASNTRPPQLIVRDISRLLALTGSPTVLAVDQIDTLFAQTTGSLIGGNGVFEPRTQTMLGQVADGLLNLREFTRKSLVVLACLPDTWQMIKYGAATPVPDRFRENSVLRTIPTAEIGKAIVAKRLAERYDRVHFKPKYPTWPIAEKAFAEVGTFTPRALLKRVERHAAECVKAGKVVELEDLTDSIVVGSNGGSGPQGTGHLEKLNHRFEELYAKAEVDEALAHNSEDKRMPVLLAAGLKALITELGAAYKQDPLPSTKPSLHARLRETLNEGLEDERHWGFRAIASDNAIAVISRITNACTMSGLDADIPKRSLFFLRNTPWPTGPKTQLAVNTFHAKGGRTLTVSKDDLKVFEALRVMHESQDEHLGQWLKERKPASKTQLFLDVFGHAAAEELKPPSTVESKPVSESAINLAIGEQPFELELEALRKHMVIFAGSGSGKTVLIRRLIEECALKGVSAIVLDPNNDLARLGDAWPQRPAGWGKGDDSKASEYLDATDVVIWTPRIAAGRPLTFQPLPNFAAVRNDPDEFRAAIDIAVAALAPRAKMNNATAKSQQGQAVLRDALTHYARSGQDGGLTGYVELLADLPEDITELGKGQKLAAEMADNLRAAMVNDPLFGGGGTPVDPGSLLQAAPGKRARVSVISMIGLNSDEQKQGFVNQLQMALFAWIKRNPAGDRPLGGLFVMDEAQTLAPSTGNTPCTASTLALVSQARKYGLGLVFATQAPRGLHNQIPGNAATQFFGLLNAPAQVAAAKEMAQAKGGGISDISLLTAGNFYAASEGQSFRKISTPNCLTHHPKAPLTPEEVIERARPVAA